MCAVCVHNYCLSNLLCLSYSPPPSPPKGSCTGVQTLRHLVLFTMSDLFRSAFNYLSGGAGGGGGGERGSEYVGQILDLGGGSKIRVKRVIAEGEKEEEMKGE